MSHFQLNNATSQPLWPGKGTFVNTARAWLRDGQGGGDPIQRDLPFPCLHLGAVNSASHIPQHLCCLRGTCL